MLSMEPIRDPEVLARMRIAFDLYQTAVDMMRQNLRRRHLDASEAEIVRRMQEWMLERPKDPPGTPLKVVCRPAAWVTRLEEALIQVETDLRVLRLRCALIGGLAVSARGEPVTPMIWTSL
jgi:hypothetical protein